MAVLTSEMFGQFTYSPELSFADLHERESALLEFIEKTLQEHGATFINFEGMGDSLHVQCVFPEHTESCCHSLCSVFAPHMDHAVEGRLLFVRKDLSLLSIYTLAEGTWQESCLRLPYAGKIGRQLEHEAGLESAQ